MPGKKTRAFLSAQVVLLNPKALDLGGRRRKKPDMQTRGAMSQKHSSAARRRHKKSDAEQRAFRKETLEQYARLEISAAEAMNRLELRCYEDLSSETIGVGLHLPRIERKEAFALAEKFVNGIVSS